jgi:hypothetical protein
MLPLGATSAIASRSEMKPYSAIGGKGLAALGDGEVVAVGIGATEVVGDSSIGSSVPRAPPLASPTMVSISHDG